MEGTEAQAQAVDTCRVEIKQAASGAIQVSTRATDRATKEEAERAVELAVSMFENTQAKLGV